MSPAEKLAKITEIFMDYSSKRGALARCGNPKVVEDGLDLQLLKKAMKNIGRVVLLGDGRRFKSHG